MCFLPLRHFVEHHMCAGWVGRRRHRRRSVHWWRRRRSLRAAGRTCFHPFCRRANGARGCGWAFGRRHLPPRWRPRLAGSLRGGGASVQRRTRRHKESSRRGGRVAGVARVCRVGRRRDGGCGGSGRRGNGVGRGRWGAGERVHRRICAGGRAEARIRRRGGEARGEVSARVFFAVASTDAARWSRSPKFSAQDRANGPVPKKNCSTAPYAAPAGGTFSRSGAAYRRFI
jgi:hypothetical protein